MRQTVTSPRLVLQFAAYLLDLENECVWRGGDMIRLQHRTFMVLRYLAEHPNRLVRKEELLRELWGALHVTESVLKTHLNQIRSALRDSARRPSIIETVHGRGYRFMPKVRAVGADDSCAMREMYEERWAAAEPRG